MRFFLTYVSHRYGTIKPPCRAAITYYLSPKKKMKYFFYLPYTYSIIKFVYVMVLSIVIEIAFLWYLENDFSYWLQVWQYHFSQAKEATSKISAPVHCSFKVELSPSKKISFYLLQWKPFKNNEKCFLFHLKNSFRSRDI